MGLVDATLIPKLLEDPPDRLHELGVHRLIVVLEIDPAPHTRNRLLPLVDVLKNHRAALLVELVYAESLDFRRACDTESLLSESFDRKTVGIPAEAALDVLSAHRLVTRHDVLDDTRQKVPVVRQSRREGRTIIESVLALALVLGERLLERAVLLPIGKDFLFHLRERDLVGNTLEHFFTPLKFNRDDASDASEKEDRSLRAREPSPCARPRGASSTSG